jgi:hypothetical protein
VAKTTSVSIKGVKRVEKSTRDFLKKVTQDEITLKQIGDTTQRWIVGNTRSGLDPNKEPFNYQISESWSEYRHKLKKFNETHKTYRFGVTNASFTGQLLNSFTYAMNKTEATVRFYFHGVRTRYTGLRGKKIGEITTNTKVYENLDSLGIRFVFIGDKLGNILSNIARRNLRKQLSLYNRLRKALR